MKRLIGIVVVMSLLLLMACPWKGEKGKSGSSGQDALIATYVYSVTPVGNPFAVPIAEIDGTLIATGGQTVENYVIIVGYWEELPLTEEIAGSIYEYRASIASDGVLLTTFKDGALYVGDACLGNDVKIIIKNWNN